MAGVDATTGRPIEGDARIAQSIRRLAVTDGDLVLRRHLANDLPGGIGRPNNEIEALAICASLAGQIAGGEPRCDLRTIRFVNPEEVAATGGGGFGPEQAADGQTFLLIEAVSHETGKPISLTELVR